MKHLQPSPWKVLSPFVFLNGLAYVLAGTTFAAVAWRTWAVPAAGSDGREAAADVVAWGAFAAMGVAAGAQEVLVGLGIHDVALYMSLLRIETLAAAVAIAAFGYHAARAWRGARRLARAFAGLAAAHLLFFLYIFDSLGPQAVVARTWASRLVFEQSLSPTARFVMAGLFFGGFLLVAATYLAALPYAAEREARFRLASSAGAILAWTSSTFVQVALSADAWWVALMPLAAMLAAAIAYVARDPPESVAAWLEHRPRRRETARELVRLLR